MTDQETATDRESGKRSGRDLVRQDSHDAIFGPAPILPGEDAAAYDAFLEQLVTDIKPKDVIDKFFIRDIVDLTWDVLRGRKQKAELIIRATAEALLKKLSKPPTFSELFGNRVPSLAEALVIAETSGDIAPRTSPSVKKLVAKWARKDPNAIKRVNKLLVAAGTTVDAVTAEATIAKFDEIERIDHRTTIAEARRNAALRELDRHRFALAQTMRGKIQEIEDAEFETIEPAAPQNERNAA